MKSVVGVPSLVLRPWSLAFAPQLSLGGFGRARLEPCRQRPQKILRGFSPRFQKFLSCSKYPLKFLPVSVIESPPNFSSAQRASVSATIASPATPAAGTTQTSERSYAALTGSRVSKSTDCNGRRNVEMGFKYPRTRISSPFETPPSMPPALLRGRLNFVNLSVAS